MAGELEQALRELFEEPVKITGAGRTDTGVHASGQVISFITSRSFPFERLAIALSAHEPERTLARGYVLVEDRAGEPLASAKAARARRDVRLRFADGRVAARIAEDDS